MVTELTEQDFENAAKSLDVSIAAIKAIAEVESNGNGFLKDGSPKILFERHYFQRYTYGKFNETHPNISNKKPGGYTKNEWERLNIAISLNSSAALKSASWGQFQIMGANYKYCGFENVEDFVIAQKTSASMQLNCFVNFIKSNSQLHNALKHHDWEKVAKLYNGTLYAKNEYDIKLKKSFIKHNIKITKSDIIFVQNTLNKLGYNCGAIDGVFGNKTSNAISLFEKDNDMIMTGKINNYLINKLKI